MDPLTLGIISSILATIAIWGAGRLAKLIKQLANVLSGSSIILVGPGFSGKTTFANILLQKQEEDTKRTQGVDSHKGIMISGGKNLRKAIASLDDFSGQMGAKTHGMAVGEQNEINGVIVFLQADQKGRYSENVPVIPWFETYCKGFAESISSRSSLEKVHTMSVVISKTDLVDDENPGEELKQRILKVIEQELTGVLGSNISRIKIFSGNLHNADFTADLVEHLVTELKLKQSLLR